jgi:hypothetical protein
MRLGQTGIPVFVFDATNNGAAQVEICGTSALGQKIVRRFRSHKRCMALWPAPVTVGANQRPDFPPRFELKRISLADSRLSMFGTIYDAECPQNASNPCTNVGQKDELS